MYIKQAKLIASFVHQLNQAMRRKDSGNRYDDRGGTEVSRFNFEPDSVIQADVFLKEFKDLEPLLKYGNPVVHLNWKQTSDGELTDKTYPYLVSVSIESVVFAAQCNRSNLEELGFLEEEISNLEEA
jgi:hypothetical protein